MENFSVVSRGFDENTPLFTDDVTNTPDIHGVSRPHIVTLTPILHGGTNSTDLLVRTRIATQMRNVLRRSIRRSTDWSDTQINQRIRGITTN